MYKITATVTQNKTIELASFNEEDAARQASLLLSAPDSRVKIDKVEPVNRIQVGDEVLVYEPGLTDQWEDMTDVDPAHFVPAVVTAVKPGFFMVKIAADDPVMVARHFVARDATTLKAQVVRAQINRLQADIQEWRDIMDMDGDEPCFG
jgi:hypothetical protein